VKAEIALNELKKEIESKSTKLYDDMKEQMNKCEHDLEKSRALREKQSRDFAKQIDELRSQHQKEVKIKLLEILMKKSWFTRKCVLFSD
jgi:centrosomal protein CEP112